MPNDDSSALRSDDVLILGAGVIGLCCALLLLRAGRAVTVLDQGQAGRGSSHGNCGTITPSHLPLNAPGTVARALSAMLRRDAPFYIKPTLDPKLLIWLLRFASLCNARDFRRSAQAKLQLLLRARERIETLVRDERLECEFAPSGTLYVWREQAALAAAAADARLLRELGVETDVLDGATLRAREPSLRADVVGGHWHPGDAQLRPDRYAAALAAAVRAAGGAIRESARVDGFDVSAGRVVGAVVGGQVVPAREFVLATGAWSPAVARPLGLRLPIQPGKGYSITYSRPQRAPAIPLVLEECSVCVTAWGSGYRLGSTMEFSGFDSTLNARRLAAIRRGAALYLEEPEGPVVEEQWFGWRPMTYDDLPLIGRVPRLANLTLATGHGMLGVTLSAITAQLVMEVITGRPPSIDPAPLRPERFAL